MVQGHSSYCIQTSLSLISGSSLTRRVLTCPFVVVRHLRTSGINMAPRHWFLVFFSMEQNSHTYVLPSFCPLHDNKLAILVAFEILGSSFRYASASHKQINITSQKSQKKLFSCLAAWVLFIFNSEKLTNHKPHSIVLFAHIFFVSFCSQQINTRIK